MTEDAATIRVLLVDDQELMRTGLRGILRPRFGFDIVGECAHGGEVDAAVQALAPDVVLMDVRMPFVDGVQATIRLRDRAGSPPVLAPTTFDDEEALAGMLRAGDVRLRAQGRARRRPATAVRVVAEGGAWLDPAVTARVLAIYRSAPSGRQTRAGSGPERPDQPRARGARAHRPRQDQRRDRRRAIRQRGNGCTHINHLFTKLQLRDRAAAVVFAFYDDLVARD